MSKAKLVKSAIQEARAAFLGQPKITSVRNASSLRPKELPATAEASLEDFIEGLKAKYSVDGVTVYDNDKPIASYNFGDTLVVDKPYRDRGIATEMVYQWRTRNPEAAPAKERTPAAQAIQEKVWDRMRNGYAKGGIVKGALAEIPELLRALKAKGSSLVERVDSPDEAVAAIEDIQKRMVDPLADTAGMTAYNYGDYPESHLLRLNEFEQELRRRVNPDEVVKAFNEGYNVPGSRVVYGGPVDVRSSKLITPGMHFAAPGREDQLDEVLGRYIGDAWMNKRDRHFAPLARPVMAKSKSVIELPDEAFEDPEQLAQRAGVDEYFRRNRDLASIESPALRRKSGLISDLLSKYGVDLGVYENLFEGDKMRGIPNISYTSFGPDNLKGFAKGGLIKKGVRELLESPLFHGGTYKSGSTVERPLYMVPDEEFARTYVEANPGEGRRVMRLDPGVGNPAHGDALWELINRYVPDVGENGYTPASAFDDNLVDQDAITALIRALREKGHDSAIAEDVPMTANGEPQNVLVMFPGDTAHEYAKGGPVRNPKYDPSKPLFAPLSEIEALGDKQFRDDLVGGAYDAAVGIPAGIAGAPGDLEGLLRLVAQYIPGVKREASVKDLVTGKQPEPLISEETILPTADDMLKYLPARDESVRNPYATMAGQLAGGFYTGPGSAAKGASALYDTAKAVPRLFEESMSPAVVSNVVKQKGGNWLAGDVEEALKPLRQRVGSPSKEPSDMLARMLETHTPEVMANLDDAGRGVVASTIDDLQRKVATNQWLDQKLTKYIKNEMATPEDPIRALAERGILHVEPGQLRGFNPVYDADFVKKVRKAMQSPEEAMGTSPAAQMWEGVSDMQLGRRSAGDILERAPGYVDPNPWLTKVPPDTRINTLMGQNQLASDLGFDHLTDELRNIIDPNSGLPPELLLKYSDLSKISVPQAVERVAKVNEWRAANKAAANLALSRNKATVPFKDYPDSDYQWVELRKPEATGKGVKTEVVDESIKDAAYDDAIEAGLEEGTPEFDAHVRQVIEDNSEMFTNTVDEDESVSFLRDALKYEGDTMGHCVGGYCDDVASGRTKIYSLRNKKTGEPHTTIEVRPTEEPFAKYVNSLSEKEADLLKKETLIQMDRLGLSPKKRSTSSMSHSDFANFQRIRNELLKARGVQPGPEFYIQQIKGKGNKAPVEKYLPYVQDFVRSGQWADVGDLQNTGMKRRRDLFDANALEMPEVQALPEYFTDAELLEAQKAFSAKLNKDKFASGGLVSQTQTGYNPDRVNALAQSLLDELNG